MKLNRPVSCLIAVALGSVVSAGSALADQVTDSKCHDALQKARGRFYHCVMEQLPKRASAGGTEFRFTYGRCLIKYDEAWAKMQSLTGSACEGPRWVDNGDGTVTDHLTGLTWEIKTNADDTVNGADPHDADNLYTISDDSDSDLLDDDGTAFTSFLASLNAGSGFAGSNGWRLPTRVELMTIITPVDGLGSYVGSLDPIFGPLPSDPNLLYWSVSDAPAFALGVGVAFHSNALGDSYAPRNLPLAVRAVRGGHL